VELETTYGHLNAAHEALLVASAISPAIAQARGYATVEDAEDLAAEGYADFQARVPGLLVPMFDVFGENGASQYRPDHPRECDGKPIKYESPEGSRNMLDVHPSMTRYLSDPKAALLVTEGVRKADALTSVGFPTIALSGVWNWRGTNDQGGTTALADWDAIALNGRQVFVIFDSDARSNSSVLSAATRLLDYLRARKAIPTFVVVPSEDGAKVGVDDYLAAGHKWDQLLVPSNYIDTATARPKGRGIVDGKSFLFNIPEGVPAVWGRDRHVLKAKGEPLMIAGPQGVRKTTTLGHLAFGLAGIPGFQTVYGYPVAPTEGKVIYLALDRPAQIARCLKRLCPSEHGDLLASKLVVWQGPLPFDLTREDDGTLADWLLGLGGTAVAVDSLKDVAGKLSDEEVGAKLNGAFQCCEVADIDVLTAHHNRKANADNKRPKALADVHGSENLTRGMGSVICLFGAAGDLQIELSHLKQPAEVVGPLVLSFDPDTGRGDVVRGGTLGTGPKVERATAMRSYFFAQNGIGTELTIDDLIAAGFGSENTIRAALKMGVEEDWLYYVEGVGAGHKSVWRLVQTKAAMQS
jgi:Domain of unknown function (DUF3854)/AAA domain